MRGAAEPSAAPQPTPRRRGRRKPARSWNELGTSIGARPLVRIAGGGDGYRRSAPFGSGSAEAKRHEFCRLARLHPHQNRALAVLLRSVERAAYVGRIGDLLARHFE